MAFLNQQGLSDDAINQLLFYDPHAAAARGDYNFPPSVDYNTDVPLSSVTSLPALPESLEQVLAGFKERPFATMALLSSDDQLQFSKYMHAAANKAIGGFADYAAQLKSTNPHHYQTLREYVFEGLGSDQETNLSPEDALALTFVRAAEVLMKSESFQEDFEKTMNELKENHYALPIMKLYGRMKEKEDCYVRSIGTNGNATKVVPSYVLRQARQESELDEILSRAG